MQTRFHRWVAVTLSAACIASAVGCYPVYRTAPYATASDVDAKGYSVPQEPLPAQQPARMGVDPGLLIAGAAAAGLLGYALGHHHNYYGPAPYWGPTYYGRGYYGRGYYRGY